ncbi:MAG: hypothetical protein AB7S44_01760 [Spirochaetales bacterium]
MKSNKRLLLITSISTGLIVLSKGASLLINTFVDDMVGFGETWYLVLFLVSSLVLLGVPTLMIKVGLVKFGRILYVVLALMIYVVQMVSFYVLSPEVSVTFIVDGYLPLLFVETAILLASAVLVLDTKVEE